MNLFANTEREWYTYYNKEGKELISNASTKDKIRAYTKMMKNEKKHQRPDKLP